MEPGLPIRDDAKPDGDPDASAAATPPFAAAMPVTPEVPFAVVIPTRNAGRLAAPMVAALRAQSVQPLEVLVINSASTDGTPEVFRAGGCRLHGIPVADFDHGGTRNMAVSLLDSRAAAVVFLTQDAIPANPQAFDRLLRPFADASVAMAYGRQLPVPRPARRSGTRGSSITAPPAWSSACRRRTISASRRCSPPTPSPPIDARRCTRSAASPLPSS